MNELLISQLYKRVLKTPDKIAIIDTKNEEITFRDLWLKACKVGSFLKQNKISQDYNISLVFDKSIEYIISMVGVLINNSSFTPIEITQPPERIKYILEKVKPKIVITNKKDNLEFINIQDIFNNGLEDEFIAENFLVDLEVKNINSLNNLAYTIFTSGSTGNPKGVQISHKGLANVINQQINLFGLNENSVSYFIYNISFDASLSDIWTSLISGTTLVLEKNFVFKGEEDLFKTFDKYGVTHVDLPPSVFKFLNPENAPISLNTIILGGEISNIEHIHNWLKLQKNIIIVYGPTEATICSSMEKCDLSWEKNYIGLPLSTVTYQVDIIQDQIGELLISGDCLAISYLDEEKLNRDKFFYKNNIRYYRTGDLVKIYPNNRWEFLGRIDRQIKFKGYLICPEEIENKLKSYTGIKNAVIIYDDIHLKAFIETEINIEIKELEDFLKQFFSKYMIPSQWKFYKNFPLLSNGKLDIKKLSQDNSFNYLNKQDITSILTNNFKKVLNIQEIDQNHSFFDLGGDSFSLLNLLFECDKDGLKILPEALYNFKTINDLAKYLEKINLTDNSVKKLLNELEILKQKSPINQVNKLDNKVINSLSENVLLTGATGFLGSRILNDLLVHTKATIYCLVRDIDKIKSIENYHFYKDRIKVIIGDITKNKFGLDDNNFSYLQLQIDSIYHIAADTNHFKNYDGLKLANIDSLITILELMSNGKYKSLNYASTLSVFVDTQPLPSICFEHDLLDNTENVYGGYAQTKWLAEKLLQSAQSYGDIYIYRLGLLTNDNSKGYDGNFDWFNSFVKGLSELKVIPKLDINNDSLYFDFTAVSFASRFMALNYLSKKEKKNIFEIFHVTAKIRISFSMLIQALKDNNIKLETISKDLWLESISINNLSKFGVVAYLALKNNDSHLGIFKVSNTIFDNNKVLKLIDKYDLQLPKIDQEDLKKFVKSIVEKNMIK